MRPLSKLRQREAALDERASLIDTDTNLSFGETLEIAARGMFFVRHFFWRYIAKALLAFFAAAIPVTIMPWPVKIVIDHVVLGRPISEATGYPPLWHPLLDALGGVIPLEVLATVTAIFVTLIVVMGAYASGEWARDEVDANLEEGHDTATRVEDRLHGGHSHVGGIYGYIEFKINTRLTQSINHYLRSRLFERIKALPMTTLEDQRIGDSVYRVMYDTPSINMPFYEGWGRTVNCIAAIAMAVGTFMSAYPESPGFVLITAAVFPVFFVLSTPFWRMARRRGHHQHHRRGHGQRARRAEPGRRRWSSAGARAAGPHPRRQARFPGDAGQRPALPGLVPWKRSPRAPVPGRAGDKPGVLRRRRCGR